jgi:outer membrane lipoprotein SlyB
MDVTFGRIAGVRSVHIGGTRSGIGSGILSALGVLGGLALGGSDITKAVGAITGGTLGQPLGTNLEDQATEEEKGGVEVLVATCSMPPKYIAVVQRLGKDKFEEAYEKNKLFNPKKPNKDPEKTEKDPNADRKSKTAAKEIESDPPKVDVKETWHSKSQKTVAGEVVLTVVEDKVSTSKVPASGISSGNEEKFRSNGANVLILSDPNKKIQPRAVLCDSQTDECAVGCAAQMKSKPPAEGKP